MKENWTIDRVGKAMSEMIFSGMDELTDKNLRRLAAFLLQPLDEQEVKPRRSAQRRDR